MVSTDAIAAMKLMASDPNKRVALAKDSTCVGGLVLVLSNPDSAVVKEALETLLLLSESHEARGLLKKHVGMVDQLETILISDTRDAGVSHLAECLFTKLSETPESAQTPLKDTSNISSRRSSRNHSLQGQGKAKSIVLQVRGLCDNSDRDLCARLLVKVKGVISITFDMGKKRCILRTKPDVKPETLAASIAKSMTMTAQQVVRNELGEESFVTFNITADRGDQEKENEDLPDYLSDDSSSENIVDDKAIKRPSEEEKKKSASWFSKATNFLSNSFYW